ARGGADSSSSCTCSTSCGCPRSSHSRGRSGRCAGGCTVLRWRWCRSRTTIPRRSPSRAWPAKTRSRTRPRRRGTSSTRRRAARIAARLAGLLGDGSPDAAFLRTMEELSEGAPPKGRHRLDRFAAALGLSPVELDLLALAGLAEEHDGYAAVLRRLHPRGEPL